MTPWRIVRSFFETGDNREILGCLLKWSIIGNSIKIELTPSPAEREGVIFFYRNLSYGSLDRLSCLLFTTIFCGGNIQVSLGHTYFLCLKPSCINCVNWTSHPYYGRNKQSKGFIEADICSQGQLYEHVTEGICAWINALLSLLWNFNNFEQDTPCFHFALCPEDNLASPICTN